MLSDYFFRSINGNFKAGTRQKYAFPKTLRDTEGETASETTVGHLGRGPESGLNRHVHDPVT